MERTERKTRNRRKTGSVKEQMAAEYLEDQGYEILECNYHCRYAEIDLVAREGEYLCFVEVKYRADDRFGAPEGVIPPQKMKKISLGAQFYMRDRHLPVDMPVRFDVVLIIGNEISLIQNAFFFQR